MKVHLINKQTILKYVEKQAKSKPSFNDWLSKVADADWKLPNDIKQTFGSADLIGKGASSVIFNIGGNDYRMICKYSFGENEIHLFICWIGTHTEYDVVCKGGLQYTVADY
ncbi:MAG: type II toxin-antitoxin system HigB family toxin [Bacteroidia bacterium]